ncbi:hypothetical protein KCP71_22130 [Salmonella enterica subsp. enterica]|nr:hypothetical protein KCP71_22130 [Salmonella enterica subsp. enterica]
MNVEEEESKYDRRQRCKRRGIPASAAWEGRATMLPLRYPEFWRPRAIRSSSNAQLLCFSGVKSASIFDKPLQFWLRARYYSVCPCSVNMTP